MLLMSFPQDKYVHDLHSAAYGIIRDRTHTIKALAEAYGRDYIVAAVLKSPRSFSYVHASGEQNFQSLENFIDELVRRDAVIAIDCKGNAELISVNPYKGDEGFYKFHCSFHRWKGPIGVLLRAFDRHENLLRHSHTKPLPHTSVDFPPSLSELAKACELLDLAIGLREDGDLLLLAPRTTCTNTTMLKPVIAILNCERKTLRSLFDHWVTTAYLDEIYEDGWEPEPEIAYHAENTLSLQECAGKLKNSKTALFLDDCGKVRMFSESDDKERHLKHFDLYHALTCHAETIAPLLRAFHRYNDFSSKNFIDTHIVWEPDPR